MDHHIEQFVSSLKNELQIRDVIARYIEVNSNGMALCPFHHDTNPSLSINNREQYFHCFGCGKGGDVITFIQEYHGIGFREALKLLADEAGLPLPEISDGDQAESEKRRLVRDVLSATANFYHECLSETSREYCNGRGINNDTIDSFQIGEACGGLASHLIEECKFPADICLEAGVLQRGIDGTARDFFYDSIIFPHIVGGRVVNLTGRHFKEGNRDDATPKYKHLPGAIRHLYNENATRGQDVCVVEGIFDCLALAQNGYDSVALLGTKLKAEHVAKFSRCKKVYIALDGDEAGRQAVDPIARSIGDKSRIVLLPDGTDINDYFRSHGPDEFRQLIEDARSYPGYMLDRIATDTRKTELVDELEPVLRELALVKGPKCEAFLKEEIKKKFRLDNHDVAELRKIVSEFRNQSFPGEIAVEISGDEREYIAKFDGLVDIVMHEDVPAFLIKEGDELVFRKWVDVAGTIYHVPPADQLPWLLPRGDEVVRHYERYAREDAAAIDRELFLDVLAYTKTLSELPGELHYGFIAAWIFHTYIHEKLNYSPITTLYALPERGKSRTGKGMVYASYRGIIVEALREPFIVRLAENCQVTIFFDVMDVWKKAEKSGAEDVLLGRFEKGYRAPKVLYPDRGAFKDTVFYTIFGPTIIGTNRDVNTILDTRGIQINMPETTNVFDNEITPENGFEFKERLTAWRARHLYSALPEVEKPCRGRLGDIMRPIIQVIRMVSPDHEKEMRDFIDYIQDQRRLNNVDSIYARILRVILSLKSYVKQSSKGRLLSIEEIVTEFNDVYCTGKKEEKNALDNRIMGYRLKELGLAKERGANGRTAIVWDDAKLKQLAIRYGIEDGEDAAGYETVGRPGASSEDFEDDEEISSGPFDGTCAVTSRAQRPGYAQRI